MYNELAIFRKKQGIESSPGDLHSNVNDEVTEALREIFKADILKLVAEFCDVAIFVVNGLEQLGHDAKSNIKMAGNNAMTESHPTPTQAVAAIMMAQSHYLIHKDIHALALIANVAMSAIDALGFHAERCILEKAKCINSREGAYNSKLSKWCKDENQDPATLYKPMYVACMK